MRFSLLSTAFARLEIPHERYTSRLLSPNSTSTYTKFAPMNNSFVAPSRTIQDFNSDLSVYRPIHVQNIFFKYAEEENINTW